MRRFPLDSVINGRPLILGHRGSPNELAENTIASFLRALEEGADGVELDVRQSGDGRLVVFHDDALQTGEVLREHSFDELREIAAAQNVVVHSLEDVLRELAGKGYLNIELKELDTTAKAADLALALMPAGSYVFSSFLPSVVRECRRLAPDVPAIYITDSCRDPERVLHLMASSDASGIGIWHQALTPAHAKLCATRDIPIFVWTVNDPAEAQRLASLGVAGIITDEPAILSALWKMP